MSINDIPGLSVLRTKMQWHQERQRVLSENVSNSDTPNFKPRDLVEPIPPRWAEFAACMVNSRLRRGAGSTAPARYLPLIEIDPSAFSPRKLS